MTDANQKGYEFDVFLAHNSADKRRVKSIGEKLKSRGLKPWLDVDQIPPGRWFQDIIQQAIGDVKSAAIFIGTSGMGKWQILELRAFIRECVETDLPVISVLLPGVEDFPANLPFLHELNRVKIKNRVTRKVIDALEWAITGEKPEPIFAPQSSGNPAAPTPSPTPPTTMIAASLPPSDPNFVGREDEKEQVRDHLLNNRSVLLHGEPGIGKTPLAIEAPHSTPIQNAFRDRMLWFERTAESLTDLCDAVARAIDAQPVLQTNDLEQKIAILRASLGDSPPLLAFNNADGNAAPAVAEFCRRVLASPVLVTSRDPVPGLQRVDVAALSPADARKLFIEYSREPVPVEEDSLQDILKFLDNNPLAIILAAGHFDGLGGVELLRQLQNRPFDVLHDPNRSVRAAFEISYERLNPEEQRLFVALGIFAGSDFSLEAVQALFFAVTTPQGPDGKSEVVIDEDIPIRLGHLVDVSLVRRSVETNRYSLHPLLKEYAKGQLEGEDGFQLRLAAYYAVFVLARVAAAPENLDAIEAEFGNIRGAVTWFGDHRTDGMPATNPNGHGSGLAVVFDRPWLLARANRLGGAGS